MTLQDVPSEVLDQIFQMVPKSSIWTCMTVCKNWNSTAARVYHTSLCLDKTQAINLINSLSNPNHNFQSINRGLWVKHLSLGGSRFNLSRDKFQKLMSFCSHLKVINMCVIDEKDDLIAYLGVLADYKSSDQQQQQQQQQQQDLQQNHMPSSLEEIKLDGDVPREAKELHFLANYAYRSSITHLHLNYLKRNIGGSGNNYLDLLPQFKSLTHLSIYNDLLTGDRYMVIYSILEACPKLKSFQLHTTRHFPDGSQPLLLRFIEQDLQQQQQQKTSTSRHYQNNAAALATKRSVFDYTKIIEKRNKYLKYLDFHIHDFDEAYMKYIVYYTPKQLSSFKLFMSDTNFYDWLIEKEAMVNQFGHHLSDVSNLEITAYTPGLIPRRRSGLFRPTPTIREVTAQEKIMRHWIFINNIIGGSLKQTQKLHTHVYMAINGYDDYQNFKLKKINNLMILKYGLKPTHPHNNLISALTPHTIVGCNAGPNMIDSLEVSDAARYTLKGCLDTVEYALKYCPKLKFMLMHRAELCYRFESFSSLNIEFDNVKLPIGQGREYIKEKHQQRSGEEIGLNHVSLTGAILSPDLMSTLTQFIPNMQVLILNQCTQPEQDIYKRSFIINLKGIQHLRYLDIDLTHLVTRPNRHLFVQFELQDGITIYYKSESCFDGRENFIPVTQQDFSLERQKEEFNKEEKEEEEAAAFMITIQCDKVDMVAFRNGVSLLNPCILRPGVDIMSE